MKEGYHITDLYFSELNRSLIFWETCWDVDTDSETRGRGGCAEILGPSQAPDDAVAAGLQATFGFQAPSSTKSLVVVF